MDLSQLPLQDGHPVEGVLAFHRRLERHLAQLARLPGHIELDGVDAHASAAAGSLLQCFGSASALHHAEEERDLLPMLEQRVAGPAERVALRELRGHIEADHREIETLWRGLRRPLEAIAEGLPRRLPVDAIQYFRALCATHISLEEGALHSLALRHFQPRDRNTLEQRLRARRKVAHGA